ncbi:MAG: adhesin, partial [Sphingobacteriales bacterium]
MKKLLLSFSVLLPSLMMAQAIATTGTEHTPAQLVNSVLLAGSGIQATNITSVTGTNYSSVNGLGYFNKGESQFPFENGIILSTGNIANAPGPSTTIQSAGNVQWIGDTDVTAVMTQVNDGQPGSVSSVNATKLEFDFIATTENFSLNYMFASAEYGNYQCGFTDAFVILLTDLTTGTSTNIAVIPGTATPVSVVTVRNSQYNPACSSVNASYFGSYYGANNLQAPINFTGTTVPMSAQATLVVGHQYHVKVAIADRNDSAFDSAIFIEGGSMDTGEPVFVINEPGDLQTCTFEQGVAT